MFNKIACSLILVSGGAAFAATTNSVNTTSSAVISDADKVATLSMADNNWAIVATSSTNGMTKLREFYDMGDLGVQQIDYVVSCADHKLSMAGFAVLTSMSSASNNANNRSYADLSFYTPVIKHDITIVDNVCGDRSIIRSAKVSN